MPLLIFAVIIFVAIIALFYIHDELRKTICFRCHNHDLRHAPMYGGDGGFDGMMYQCRKCGHYQ